jgi:hypothetical protein
MNRTRHPLRRGSALMVMILTVVVMTGAAYALLQANLAGHKEQREGREALRARYVAQAGLAAGMYDLRRGQTGVLGTEDTPLSWGRARYYVTRTDPSPNVIALQSTGLDQRQGARMEVTLRRLVTTMWRFGAFGKEFLHMDSNARVDSYNSTLGTYATQDVNGAGSNLHAHTDGDVGSNGNVGLDQNAKVWGDALAGPAHVTTVLGNAVVTGSTLPMPAPIELPDLVLPSYPSSGALTVSSNSTVPSGNRAYTNLTVNNNKTLTINGPASVVITNLRVKSGGSLRFNTTGGPVTLWVVDNFILDSNALVAPLNLQPKDLQVNLLSDNVINPEVSIQLDTVDFASNTKLYGMMYAPNAALSIRSNFELFGSVIGRSIDLSSNATFHFDEALLDATGHPSNVFETLCWRELPYSPD